jgi:hypothetical protein
MLVPSIRDNDWAGVRKAIQKLSGPKLGIAAAPTFADLTLTNLTASRLVYTDANKQLESVSDLTSWIAGAANEIDIADDGDGTITIGIVDPLAVNKGGTGAATLTDHGILLGSGTGAITPLGVATNGQLPIGSTGADPTIAALTGTANQITVTNGAGSITLSTPQNIDTGASFVVADITVNNTGLHILDTNASHDLIIAPGSDLSADRTLTLTTGDAARTITLSGNPTLSDWFDQSVKQAASPTFGGFTKVGDASNYLSVASDGEIGLTGTARVTKSIYLSNAAFTKGTTAPTQVILGNYNGWEFDIGDDAVMTVALPPDWAAGTDLTVRVCWYIDEAYASDKEVQWRVDWSAAPTDFSETTDSPTHTGQIDSGDIDIATNAKEMGMSTIGTISGSSLSLGDTLGFTLSRIAVTNDNPTNDPGVHHLLVLYTSDKLGTAT